MKHYWTISILFLIFVLFNPTYCGVADNHLDAATAALSRRKPEDSIPVVEIRGEGKPMTPAQIRSLEEISNGGPLDIKIDKTWVPAKCQRAAKRLDFVTFHYKGFLEDGKKFDQTYGRGPIKIQLGTSMTMPGLDKGLRGMCDQELRKLQIPYRLSRKNKSKIWKYIPNEEHWITFNIEMLIVEEWTLRSQFIYMDVNNDSFLTENELKNTLEQQRKDYGKSWRNEDIDNTMAVRYYINYFDNNGDGKINYLEFERIMERDMKLMKEAKSQVTALANNKQKTKNKQRGRDPGVAWILDFNNDGIVSYEEVDNADQLIMEGPKILPLFNKDEL